MDMAARHLSCYAAGSVVTGDGVHMCLLLNSLHMILSDVPQTQTSKRNISKYNNFCFQVSIAGTYQTS